MSGSLPILILEQPCDSAIDWVVRQISGIGLQVVRTFDLHVARQDPTSCPCPHHGTDHCDCQMVVLLIYGSEREPISLIAHGYDGQAWFSVVDNPQQKADPRLETAIRLALAPHIPAPILNQASQSHTT